MELKLLVMGVACAFAALLAIASYVKWREVQAAQSWLPTPGTILMSHCEARRVNINSGAGTQTRGKTEMRNFASIAFAYTVNGKPYRGTRYSLRENLGNFGVQETLAQYPKGAKVTVYYDPAKPSQAVIERTMPDGAFKFMACLAASVVLVTFVLLVTVGGLLEAVRPHVPDPKNAGASLMLLVFAAFASRMAWLQQARARAAAEWPQAKGLITQSGVEAFSAREGMGVTWRRSWRRMFQTRVVYTYKVGATAYCADRISFGASVSATLPFLVAARARRYPVNSVITVLYDPSNPAQAVLEPRAYGLWLVWGIAALAVLAAFRFHVCFC